MPKRGNRVRKGVQYMRPSQMAIPPHDGPYVGGPIDDYALLTRFEFVENALDKEHHAKRHVLDLDAAVFEGPQLL